jgi:toxin HigB-1
MALAHMVGRDQHFHRYVAERSSFESDRESRFPTRELCFAIQILHEFLRFDQPPIDLWTSGCAFFVEDTRSRHIPSDLESRLFRKLQMIDDATTDQDLRVPPSNHFEKLRGNLAGFHSIRVNSQWRLVFRWDGSRGEAEGVYLDDHSYR